MANLLSDEDLIRGVLGGDESAFAQLYQRYRVPVYATAYRIIQDAEAAKDATQEIFIKLWRSLGSWKADKARFTTWLYRLASNHAIDCWRSRRSRPEATLERGEDEAARLTRESVLAEAFHSPYRELETGERIAQIRQCVSALPELQKKVFVLRYFQGLKLEEIAEMENCNLGTVKTSLFRATQTVRRRVPKSRGSL